MLGIAVTPIDAGEPLGECNPFKWQQNQDVRIQHQNIGSQGFGRTPGRTWGVFSLAISRCFRSRRESLTALSNAGDGLPPAGPQAMIKVRSSSRPSCWLSRM